jgi:hypothetical protein
MKYTYHISGKTISVDITDSDIRNYEPEFNVKCRFVEKRNRYLCGGLSSHDRNQLLMRYIALEKQKLKELNIKLKRILSHEREKNQHKERVSTGGRSP